MASLALSEGCCVSLFLGSFDVFFPRLLGGLGATSGEVSATIVSLDVASTSMLLDFETEAFV